MGMVSCQFKTFADARVAGGNSVPGPATLAAQLGLVWVGQSELNGLMAGLPVETAINRLGSQLGPIGKLRRYLMPP